MSEQTNVNEILAGLSDEEKAKLIEQALKAKAKKPTRLGEAHFVEKYADDTRWSIKPGNAREDNHGTLLLLSCSCGKDFNRYTSDLHTCHGCATCTSKAQVKNRKVRNLRLKAAALLLKQQENEG